MTISDQLKLAAIVKANKLLYRATDTTIKAIFPALYAKQMLEIDQLKRLSPADLADEFRKIAYVKDTLFSFLNPIPASQVKIKQKKWQDVEIQAIKPPAMTWFQKRGDCDDVAFLASAVTGGQVFCILESIENKNSAGHFICIDRMNNIWSKARKGDPGYDGKHSNIQDTAKRYVKKWKYAINLNPVTFTYTAIERNGR